MCNRREPGTAPPSKTQSGSTGRGARGRTALLALKHKSARAKAPRRAYAPLCQPAACPWVLLDESFSWVPPSLRRSPPLLAHFTEWGAASGVVGIVLRRPLPAALAAFTWTAAASDWVLYLGGRRQAAEVLHLGRPPPAIWVLYLDGRRQLLVHHLAGLLVLGVPVLGNGLHGG